MKTPDCQDGRHEECDGEVLGEHGLIPDFEDCSCLCHTIEEDDRGEMDDDEPDDGPRT